MHHHLHPRQPLYLLNDWPEPDDDCTGVFCNKCRGECKGFVYQCPGTDCKFTLDILCATTVKIMHKSHKHELTFIRRRENRIACSVCGLEHEGEFYSCDVCHFDLHRDCALLPDAILHKKHGDVDGRGQPHPLILSFTFPENALKFKKYHVCSICDESLLLGRSGVYFCTKCNYTIHIKCAISDPDDFHSVSIAEAASNSVIHFPMIENEHTSLVQYLMDNERNNKLYSGGGNEGIGHLNKVLIEKVHDHELIFYENDEEKQHNGSHICNACCYPISPPFYTCHQCIDFYLHKCCTDLPLHYHHPSMHYVFGGETCRDRPLKLLPRISNSILHAFQCSCCNSPSNGFVYGCNDCSVQLNVTCAILPEAITYEKHRNSHILLLSRGGLPNYFNRCHACKGTIGQDYFYYECCSCTNFKLHSDSALAPLTISHKYDRHPLQLTYPEFSTPKEDYNSEDDDDFCEICEKVMRNEWFYQCKECVTSFHTYCCFATTSGAMLKFKLGETIRVKCHDCPLTSIYMLTSYSYTCGLCKETIQGKSIDLAFECTKCGFWLDSDCAEEQWIGN